MTAEQYDSFGLPWFDFYDADRGDLPTGDELASIMTVGDVLGEKDDDTATPVFVVQLGNKRPRPVAAGEW